MGVIFFGYCLSGLKAAAPAVVPSTAAGTAAAPVSTLLLSRLEMKIQSFILHTLRTVPEL